jgi:hypothetical protein
MLRLVLLVLCLIAALPARAQQAGADYKQLVERAVKAQQAGEYPRAIELFRAAHQLEPSARTLRGLGVSEFLAGDFVSAIAHLEAALAHPTKPLGADLRASVNELLERARARVARYELTTEPAGAAVQVDAGERIAAGVLVLAPGSHALTVGAEGYEPQTLALEAAAGGREALTVTLQPVAPAMPEVAVQAPPVQLASPLPPVQLPPAELAPTVDRKPVSARMKRTKWALFTIGSASAATVLGLTIMGIHRTHDVEDACGTKPTHKAQQKCADGEGKAKNIPTLKGAVIATAAVSGLSLGGALGLWVVELRANRGSGSASLSVGRTF